MSCDLEVKNERKRCWEKVSIYITLLIINIIDFFFFLRWVIISLVKRKHRKHPVRQGVKLTSFTVFYPKRHSWIYMFVRLSGAVAKSD